MADTASVQGSEAEALDCDFCVVGAGAAGCVMTARLVAAGFRVTLIMDGPDSAHK